MVMVDYGHQGEEAVIYGANFKTICAMGVERRDKGIATLLCRFYDRTVVKKCSVLFCSSVH